MSKDRKVSKDRRGLKEIQEILDQQDRKVSKDRRGLKEIQEILDRRDQQDLKEIPEILDRRDLQDRKVSKDRWGQRVLRVIRTGRSTVRIRATTAARSASGRRARKRL